MTLQIVVAASVAVFMMFGPATIPAANAQSTTPSAAALPGALPEATVRALQEALNRQGIAVKVDGVMSDETRDAVGKYQSQHHLPVTGQPDKATLDKLGVRAAATDAAGATVAQAPAPSAGPGLTPQGGMMGQGMPAQGGMMGQGMPAQGGMMMMNCPMMMQGQMAAMMQMMQGMMQMMQTMQTMQGQMQPGQAPSSR